MWRKREARLLPASPIRSRLGDLVLRLRIEVRRVVALVELRRRIAECAVDHSAALDRGSIVDLVRPAVDVLVFLDGQELGRLVSQPFTSPPYQGKVAMSANRVFRAAEIFTSASRLSRTSSWRFTSIAKRLIGYSHFCGA